MLRFYRLSFIIVLLICSFWSINNNLFAQCSISNLNASYCLNSASVSLTGGTNYYGPGVMGSTFNPAAIGTAGTYTIATTDGNTSSYNVVTSGTFNPITLTSSTVLTILSNGNELVNFPAGFNFKFFGNAQTSVRLFDNGFVRFSGTANNVTAQLIPDSTFPDDLIAFAWDDLNPLTGTIEYGVVGTAPTRVFVMNYTNVQFTSSLEYVTAQVQLHESSNIIEIHSTHIGSTGGNKTMGIENNTGTVAYAVPGRNQSGWVANNDFVAFVPSCSEKRSVVIYGLPSNLSVFPSLTSVCSGGNTYVTIGNSQAGVEYQLRNDANDAPLSSFFSGTGSNLIIPTNTITADLTIKVFARNTTTLCGQDLTNKVAVTVTSAPAISSHPNPTPPPVCEGGSITFNVTATGASLSYQWKKEGVDIAGAVSSSYTISNVTTSDAGTYTVLVSSTCGASITSNDSELVVYGTPKIISQPGLSQTICTGDNITFTVDATGTQSPTYEWRYNSVPISGATNPSYVITGATTLQAGTYDVVVRGACTGQKISNGTLLFINQRPVITVQPAPTQTKCVGQGVIFNVSAGGTTSPTYQWRYNLVPITGANNSSYTISSVNLSDAGNYDVEVRGACTPDVVTSNPASLTVNTSTVTITSQPNATLTVCEGNSATFSVTASGSNLNYQWKKNGVDVAGATLQTYTISATTLADAGTYTVAVTGNSCSSPITSNASSLTVNTTTGITTQPSIATVCESGTAQFSVVSSGSGLSYMWYENNVPISNGGVYSGATLSTLTLTNVTSAFNLRSYKVEVTGSCGMVMSSSVALNINEQPEITVQPVNKIICQGLNTSFVVNSGVTTSATYQWQVSTNGGLSYANLTNTGIYTNTTTQQLDLTATPLSNNGYLYRVIVGSSVGCSPSVTSNASSLTVNTTTGITTQPSIATVCESGTAQFSVVSSGSGLSYMWYENNVPISNGGVYSGATLSTLTLTNVTSAFNLRSYKVEVTGSCGTVMSSSVALNINEQPEITVQPVNKIICQGLNTSFVVNSGVTTSATYQWQVSTNGGLSYANLTNTGIYTNTTTQQLDLTATPLSNNGYLYRVIVGSSVGCSPSITSNASSLTVNTTTGITTQPSIATVCESGTAQFSVVSSGSGLSYVWYENNVPISNGGVYSGATLSTLTLTNVTSAFNLRSYKVEVTGSCGTVMSSSVALNINEQPEITVQPVNKIICQGLNTSFVVNSGVTTSATYQWQVSTNGGLSYANLTNTGIYTNTTTQQLDLTATPLSNNGYLYRVIVGSSVGCSPSITSNASSLTVNTTTAITTQPSIATVCESGTAQFSVVSSGSGLSYVWYENNVPISNGGVYSGATLSTLTLTNVTSAFNLRSYKVEVTGSCGTVMSSSVGLNINEQPEITVQPVNKIICQGLNTSFVVNSGVTTSATYQWQVSTNGGLSYANLTNTGIYTNTTTQQLDLTATPLSNNGYLYRVIVGSSVGCSPSVTSNASSLTVNTTTGITTQPSIATVCESGTAQFSVVSSGSGLSYVWYENNVPISNGGVYSGATLSTLTLTNVTSAFNLRSYKVEVTGSCGTVMSSSATLNVDIRPTASALPESICNGQQTNISITNPNNVSGTSYIWTVQSSTNVTGQSSGLGPLISQILTLTNNVISGSVTYQIIPSAAGCDGPSFAVTVTISPIPVAAATDKAICSGSNTNLTLTNFNGVANTTFSWSVSSSLNVTGAGSGSGSLINQILTSTDGTSAGYVIYSVIPSANGCSGNPISVRVDVNPSPFVTNGPTSLIQEICSGTPLNFTPSSPIGTISYTWTSSVIGTLSGVSPNGIGAVTDVPVNNTNSAAVIIYNIIPGNAGCFGAPVNFVVTVRPKPNAAASGQIICSGAATSVNITNPNLVAGTIFNWTLQGTSSNITGGAPGTGNKITQTLSSTDGTNNGIANYQIIPSANGCAGTPVNVSVTVKPVPVITTSSTDLSAQICSAQSLGFLPTSTITPGTNYTWTSTIAGASINGASVTSSGNNNINDSPVNTGSVAGTVTYHITPHFNSCSGQPVDYVVTVKPVSSANGSPTTICSGELATIVIDPSPKNVVGTTFTWTATPDTNVSGSSSGSGSLISQTLSTTNSIVGNVVYHIVPTASGCNGMPYDVSVTVNPIATVNAGVDYSVCEPSSIAISGTIGGSSTTGIWSIESGAGSLSASATSAGNVTATYTLGSGDIASLVKLKLTTDDPDGLTGPCAVKSDDLVIDIHRQARLTVPADYTVCEPSQINLVGTLSGSATSGSWSVLSGTGTLTVSSVTGSNVTAIYYPGTADVAATVTFQLTTTDPDGAGLTNPCVPESAILNIKINKSAKVNAGLDFEVCEDEIVELNGSYDNTPLITWSGASGSSQFSDVNYKLSTYTLTTADIANGEIVLTITGDDPDGPGLSNPCGIVYDDVHIKINPLPKPVIVGLRGAYAENDLPENLIGFPATGSGYVGIFTGPGIIAGTNIFDPSNANIGYDTIRYSVLNTITGCLGDTTKVTVVNQLTTIGFGILSSGQTTADFSPSPAICNTNGKARLIGVPDPSTTPNLAFFSSPTPTILGSDALGQFVNTQGLMSGEYYVEYSYTNPVGAKSTLIKKIIVNASPLAIIGAVNSCVKDSVSFTDLSTISDNVNNGVIDSWLWDFDYANIKKTLQNPKMKYDQEGFYDVSLTVKTNQNCSSNATKQIFIGTTPTVDFEWSEICSGQATKFKDKSTISLGYIKEYSWNFDDGYVLDFGLGGDPVPPGTHDGNTFNTYKNPEHKYQTFKEFNVTLTLNTDVGCTDKKTKRIFILDYKAPTAISRYFEDFEGAQSTWVKGSVTESSWLLGLPTGNEINKASSGTHAWWTGVNPDSVVDRSTYLNNEKSEVIGPCLDISSLERPMISLDYWCDSQDGFDGTVIQYSFNGGLTWQTIGNANTGEGINWYNTRDITGQPGGQDNFAWSNTQGGWKNARFNLDQIPVDKRDTVVFKMAFGSDDKSRFDRVLNGFAFDNIYIGEKNRNVLIEHFTNVSSKDKIAFAAQNIDALYDQQTSNEETTYKAKSDFTKIQYHLGSPIPDPINDENPTDPGARSLYYSFDLPPYTIMDGISGEYFNTYFNGDHTLITAKELDRRALEDALFTIKIDTFLTSQSELKFDVKFKYRDSVNVLNNSVILHAVLVEKNVGMNRNVVRKLLPNVEGVLFTGPWTVQRDTATVSVNYTMDVPIENPDSLLLVAFVQDKVSDRIHQSLVINAPRKVGIKIVGLPDDQKRNELKDIRIYPNPARGIINFELNRKINQSYAWQFIDQRGITVLSGNINNDLTKAQQVNISELASGIYFVKISAKTGAPLYRKVVVIN